jgi:uncharacterized protein with FMN-binding domain
MPSARLSRGLVAVAASAITAVYGAGYMHTQAADAILGGGAPAAAASADSADPSTPFATVSPEATSGAANATASPTALSITDQTVEQYADQHHVSWDDARAQMRAAGGVEATATATSASGTTASTTSTSGTAASATTSSRPASTLASAPTSTAVRPVAAPPTATAVVVRTAPTPTPAAAAAASSSKFKDGAYKGVGTSRRGDIQVSLDVQGGRIATVTITGSTTEYPTRDIANLPAQVVSRQSPQVDSVSGATYSAQAFRSAVQQALQRAQA